MKFLPKITRIGEKNKFTYLYIKSKKPIVDEELLTFIKKIGIPPAWKNVKIDTKKNAELVATGNDVKGKKQYIYSAKHNERVRKEKFKNLIDLVKKLPSINKQLNSYIKQIKMSKN